MEQDSFFKFKSNLIVVWLLVQCLMVIVKSSPVLFERDILIDQDTTSSKIRMIKSQSEDVKRTKRGATNDLSEIWDFGVIPYVFDDDADFSDDQKVGIEDAMREWEKSTCIKFVERNHSEHIYFIRFTKMSCGCCSFVGRAIEYNDGQEVSLSDGCHYKGGILHELGHVIGFEHEHQRPDRDDYVDIWTENIMDDTDVLESDFNKKPNLNSLGEPYDYDSIMHYSYYAFSKDPYNPKFLTILPKTGPIKRIGLAEGLSPGDIRLTNKLYKCPACGDTFVDQQGAFRAPNYLKKSGESFQCEWRILAKDNERIRLNVTELDIFTSIDCHSNYLEIRDGYWHKSPLLGRFCGTNINIPVIESSGNRMVINYISNQSDHQGFVAEYLSYSPSVCGGDLTVHHSNKIESPNYKQLSSSNIECIWRITNPSAFKVALVFQTFDLDEHPNCIHDFVEVRDGDSADSRLIGKYCGQSIPPMLSSTSNQMFIRFVSTGLIDNRGFSATKFLN